MYAKRNLPLLNWRPSIVEPNGLRRWNGKSRPIGRLRNNATGRQVAECQRFKPSTCLRALSRMLRPGSYRRNVALERWRWTPAPPPKYDIESSPRNAPRLPLYCKPTDHVDNAECLSQRAIIANKPQRTNSRRGGLDHFVSSGHTTSSVL